MAKYQIVGVEHIKGESKKTGRPYDMDILHVIDQTPSRNPEVIGLLTDKLVISRDSGILMNTPEAGEMWEITFDRRGYVDEAHPCF